MCIVLGCCIINKNRSPSFPSDNDTLPSYMISEDDIEKITIGLTIEEVIDMLGEGIPGDSPIFCVSYHAIEGGVYEICFIELQDAERLGEMRNEVTGVAYFNNANGYFLLPEELRGESWEEVMSAVSTHLFQRRLKQLP